MLQRGSCTQTSHDQAFRPTHGETHMYGIGAIASNILSIMLYFFRSFFSLGKSNKLRSGRLLDFFFAHGNGTALPHFIYFAFKISGSLELLFPWASSWCSKIVTRLSRTINSNLAWESEKFVLNYVWFIWIRHKLCREFQLFSWVPSEWVRGFWKLGPSPPSISNSLMK